MPPPLLPPLSGSLTKRTPRSASMMSPTSVVSHTLVADHVSSIGSPQPPASVSRASSRGGGGGGRRMVVEDGAASKLLAQSAKFSENSARDALAAATEKKIQHQGKKPTTEVELAVTSRDLGPRAPNLHKPTKTTKYAAGVPALDLNNLLKKQKMNAIEALDLEERQQQLAAEEDALSPKSGGRHTTRGRINNNGSFLGAEEEYTWRGNSSEPRRFLSKNTLALLPPSIREADRDTQKVVGYIAASLHGNPLEEWECERMLVAIHDAMDKDKDKNLLEGKTIEEKNALFEKLYSQQIHDSYVSPQWRKEFNMKEQSMKAELRAIMHDIDHTKRKLRIEYATRNPKSGNTDHVNDHVSRIRRGSFYPEARFERMLQQYQNRQSRLDSVKAKQDQLAKQKTLRDTLLMEKDSEHTKMMKNKDRVDYGILLRQRQALWLTIMTALTGARVLHRCISLVQIAKERRMKKLEATKTIQRAYRKFKNIEYTREKAAIAFFRSISFVPRFRRAISLQKIRVNEAASLVIKFLRDNNDITAQFRKVAHKTRIRILRTQRLVRQFMVHSRQCYTHLIQHWDRIQKEDYQRARLGVNADRKRRGSVSDSKAPKTNPFWLADLVWKSTALTRRHASLRPAGERTRDPIYVPNYSAPMPWSQSNIATVAAPLGGSGTIIMEELRQEMLRELVVRMRFIYMEEVNTTKRVWKKYLKMMSGLMTFSNNEGETRAEMLSRLFKLYPKPPIHQSFSNNISDHHMLQMVRWAHLEVRDGGKSVANDEKL